MAKTVTVLGLEGAWLRGVRLEENGDDFARRAADSWPAGDARAGTEEQLSQSEEQLSPSEEQPSQEETPAGADALARALTQAAGFFKTREVALALPLSKFLVRCVRLPVDAREELFDAAREELNAVSPFPDEELAVAAEVMAETDTDITAVCAALPAAAADELTAALAAADVRVTRTDITALGWLRTLWPRVCERNARRVLALFNFGDGWDMAVLDEGVLNILRGIGETADPAELAREITLTLLAEDGDAPDICDVAVCSAAPVDPAVLAKLAAFGPVRTVVVDDPLGGVDGCARRETEGGTFDATPADWSESRTEARFRRKLKIFLSAAIGIWALVMGVFYGVEYGYEFARDRQKALQKERAHVKAFKEVSAMTNRVALVERYSDRAHCALEMLKLVTDCLPDSEDMTFRSFRYVSGESVRVQGGAREREDLRTFIERLEGAEDAESETRIFESVKQSGGETETKSGLRFAIDAVFPAADDGRAR